MKAKLMLGILLLSAMSITAAPPAAAYHPPKGHADQCTHDVFTRAIGTVLGSVTWRIGTTGLWEISVVSGVIKLDCDRGPLALNHFSGVLSAGTGVSIEGVGAYSLVRVI